MRCHICDNLLAPDEIKFYKPRNQWEPCGTCIDVSEQVFGAVPEDEIDAALNQTTVEALYAPPE